MLTYSSCHATTPILHRVNAVVKFSGTRVALSTAVCVPCAWHETCLPAYSVPCVWHETCLSRTRDE